MNSKVLLLSAFIAASTCNAAPQLAKWGVTVNAGSSVYPGNVIFSDCKNPNVDAIGRVQLVSQTGTVLHTWKNTGYMFRWLAKPVGTDGTILTYRYASTTNDCQNGTGNVNVQRAAYNSTSTKVYSDAACAVNHDFEVIPDGTYLILCRKLITDTNVSSQPFYDDIIRRVDGSGNVLWEWSTAAHYDQLGISTEGKAIIAAGQMIYPPQSPTEPTSSDVFHTNNIQFIPNNVTAATIPAFTAGNIMVDQRNTNLIFIIDYASGDIVWQVGGISIGQHTARVIPAGYPGDGHILMLNNGSWGGYPALVGFKSSVQEYDPILNGVVWSYSAAYPAGQGFYTPYMGSTQRLPNGNTFVDEAQWGRIFELDPAGNIVWEYVPKIGGVNGQAPDREIYRAYKVEACWPGCDPESGTGGQWTW